MKVFLRKDVVRVGRAGEIVKVSDGFALNYIVPQGLGVVVTPENENHFKKRTITLDRRQEVIATQSSMLADRIKSLELTIKRKIHDEGKLYGAIHEADIVELLAQKGIKLTKSQVLLSKAIKKIGSHQVTIKLSSKLQPIFTLKVVAE